MRASSAKCARSDIAYGAALLACIRRHHPEARTQRALAALLGLSRAHLCKIERMTKALLPLTLQLQLEAHLPPALVQQLRARFAPRPPAYWVARTEDQRHA